MNHKERMLQGLPFKPWEDGLSQERMECQKRLYRYNHLSPEAREEADALLKEIFGETGNRVRAVPPLYCDYGKNIRVRDREKISLPISTLQCWTPPR